MRKQNENINWSIVKFNDLSTKQLFDVLQLRNKVFIVEQDCAYLDIDSKDSKSFHVLAYNNKSKLIATSRVLPPGVSYTDASIGRVAVSIDYRKMGIGNELNRRSISFIYSLFGKIKIRISAQQHLTNFYKNHRFEVVSKPYDEDGIPHVEMLC